MVQFGQLVRGENKLGNQFLAPCNDGKTEEGYAVVVEREEEYMVEREDEEYVLLVEREEEYVETSED